MSGRLRAASWAALALLATASMVGCGSKADPAVARVEVELMQDVFASDEVAVAFTLLGEDGQPTRAGGVLGLELVEVPSGTADATGDATSLGCSGEARLEEADFGEPGSPRPAQVTVGVPASDCRPAPPGHGVFFRATWESGTASTAGARQAVLVPAEGFAPDPPPPPVAPTAEAPAAESPSEEGEDAAEEAPRWPGETPGPPPTVGGRLPDSDWRPWRSPDGRVSAEMPAAPRREAMPSRDAFFWDGSSEQVSCAVAHYPVTRDRALADYVTSHRQQAASDPGGELVSDRAVRAGDLEGHEIVSRVMDRGTRFEIVERLFVQGGRVYMAQATYPAERAVEPRCVQTFDVTRSP
ncbi:MAG: hypothetical protein ACFCGT_25140 [Sandaracinaceae bacterium]